MRERTDGQSDTKKDGRAKIRRRRTGGVICKGMDGVTDTQKDGQGEKYAKGRTEGQIRK